MIEEQTYYQSKGGSRLRPFLLFSGIRPRGYSTVLERAITDFGSEVAFGRVNDLLQEHYGITVPENGIRSITLKHAEAIKYFQDGRLGNITAAVQPCVISETDGSMVPIVRTQAEAQDKRKGKELIYREARLTLAHAKGSVTPVFSATLGDVKTAGKHLSHCVIAAGANEQTKIHSVGDGAVWIADQIEKQFGSKATYLIDFYHLCEYLSVAASSCSQGKDKEWLETQKALLKKSRADEVLLALKLYIEPRSVPDAEAPVRACYRYIKNRLNQLDYKAALENNLPIGSGEVESAHRYVIQARLKLAGAWWLEANAEYMLAMRTNRANREWEQYWFSVAA